MTCICASFTYKIYFILVNFITKIDGVKTQNMSYKRRLSGIDCNCI